MPRLNQRYYRRMVTPQDEYSFKGMYRKLMLEGGSLVQHWQKCQFRALDRPTSACRHALSCQAAFYLHSMILTIRHGPEP
jgi:hypothetical protein